MPEWLVHSLLSRLAWEIVIILGGGTVLGYLKAKAPQVASPALYGIAGAALLSILLFTFTGRAVLSQAQPETTTDNVEENIRTWLDGYGVAVTKEKYPNAMFTYRVTLRNGTTVGVIRSKEDPRYIGFRADIKMDPDHIAILKKMTLEQKQDVIVEVTMEMARSKVNYNLGSPALEDTMKIAKSVLITNALTEDSFASHLSDMDSDVQLARGAIRFALERNRTNVPH
jgi:hypothetical protein